MPDETATSPETGGDNASRGSEFSKPTGAGDEALWAKHFGGSESEKKPSGERKSASSKSEAGGSKEAKTSSASRSEKASGAAEKPSKEPAKNSRESTSGKEASTPKDTKSPKKDDASEATGQKTAKEDPPDPEDPSKKARDLFEAAEKTEDKREARKLFKRAMVEAFGKVPEEFDDKRYVAARTERAAAQKAIDARAADVEARFVKAKEALKGPIYVMRQLESSGLAEKLSVPLMEKTLHVMKALVSLEGGDFTQLAEVVARASGVDHDEAMKRFVRGVKISPEGKASREAAARAEARAAAAETRIQEMERRLQERDTTRTEAEKKAEHSRRVEAHRAQYLEDITTELDGHPVLQLPRGAERVMAYLIKTADPKLKAARYTFDEAAARVVAHERKRVQSARFLVDGETEAAPARSEPRRIGSVSRTETADAGVRSADPVARFNEIFDRHASSGRRR